MNGGTANRFCLRPIANFLDKLAKIKEAVLQTMAEEEFRLRREDLHKKLARRQLK